MSDTISSRTMRKYLAWIHPKTLSAMSSSPSKSTHRTTFQAKVTLIKARIKAGARITTYQTLSTSWTRSSHKTRLLRCDLPTALVRVLTTKTRRWSQVLTQTLKWIVLRRSIPRRKFLVTSRTYSRTYPCKRSSSIWPRKIRSYLKYRSKYPCLSPTGRDLERFRIKFWSSRPIIRPLTTLMNRMVVLVLQQPREAKGRRSLHHRPESRTRQILRLRNLADLTSAKTEYQMECTRKAPAASRLTGVTLLTARIQQCVSWKNSHTAASRSTPKRSFSSTEARFSLKKAYKLAERRSVSALERVGTRQSACLT